MSDGRITKQMFIIITRNKGTTIWLKQTFKNLVQLEIKEKEIQEECKFKTIPRTIYFNRKLKKLCGNNLE